MSDLRIAAQQALEAWQTATYGHPSHHKATLLAMTALRAALAQQAEPAQEPVAWRYKPMIGSSWSLSDDGYYISCKRDKGYIVDSLHTAPPQRKPLTLEEAQTLLKAERIWLSNNTAFRITRAVERAHGIKE